MTVRHAVASLAIATGLIAALPPGASAAESCLNQDEVATDQNQLRVEASLFCLTNVYRLRNGVGAMSVDTRLAAAARGHSLDMFNRDFFSHDNPDGDGPSERAQKAGYPGPAGENIAYNPAGTALSLFDQWRVSPGHNMNMLNPIYRAGGFGVIKGCCYGASLGVTGTQNFGFVPANTQYTALDLFASSDACAKAKTTVIGGREKLKRKKGKAKKRLKGRIRRANKRAARICKPPV